MTRSTRLLSTAAAIGSAAVLVFSAPAFAGGANDMGYYYNDCRDSCAASGNGNGTGWAKGRPAAGSVGKADTKTPKGQEPNETEDGNNGYECDGNQGVAKGNPAHSGCEEVPR